MKDTRAIVLHRTYGAWGGDYSVGKQGIFHLLIGKADGAWAQFAPSENAQWHCNGANMYAYGIELEGTNDQPLTDWQAAKLGEVLHWLSATHGIPLNYLDPDSVPAASIWVNSGNFTGVISHCSVQTDDGSSQHSDRITVADFQRAVGTGGSTGGSSSNSMHKESDMVIYGTKDGKWFIGTGYGVTEIDGGTAYVHALAGCPVVRDLEPLALVGICVTLAKARKAADFWFAKV